MNIIKYVLAALLIGVVTINLTQRRHLTHGESKRFATLYAAGLMLLLYLGAILIDRAGVSPFLLLLLAAADAVIIFWQRKHFPFTLYCVSCRSRLSFKRILYFDSNLCEPCDESEKT
ncbi:MAG: hypothetical protein E4H36_05050 [Spirochaetales bacterium]|nr:MAG: hypothetical protein E4H36_05050 [Spirochaetales bacterium]